MKIIDSHCHLDSFRKLSIPKDILPIGIGHSHKSNLKTVELAEKSKLPYVLGIAPQTAVFEGITNLEEWINFIKSKSPVAIGEVGLDFHWAKTEKHLKDEHILFEKMLDLAGEMNLPVVIHSRKAEKEVFEILKKRNKKDFLMHYYSGDLSLAKEIVKFGGLISISPLHSKNRKKVIESIPLKFLVVETDAPYVVKSIEEVKKAIEYIADIKGLEIEEVASATSKNAVDFFKLEGFDG